MVLSQQYKRGLISEPSASTVAHILAWLVAALLLFNVLNFVRWGASPIVRDDAWYFLDVFLRKAIDHTLGVSDFFVRRMGADHSQPLFKLVLLFEWRCFDLDLSVGAVVGVLAAATSALVFYRIIIAERDDSHSDVFRLLAWVTICAVLFTLNANAAIWTWPLVALENITNLIILLFVLVVWHARQKQRYLALTLVTLLLAITSDDSALVTVVAVVVALLLVQLHDPKQKREAPWRLFTVIGVCTALVRIGYASAPIVGGVPIDSLSSHGGLLLGQFREKGWWMWVVLPLTLPIFYQSPIRSIHAETWLLVQIVMAVMLVVAHLWFWWTACRGKYNRTIFAAVCLMLVSYGWIAGIILGRVATFGSDYLYQPRYVLLYGGHLIALLLMWVGSFGIARRPLPWRSLFGSWLPTAGCLVLLVGQLKISRHEWHARSFLWSYYANMAHQIDDLAKDPEREYNCVPELPVCRWSSKKRAELTELLSLNRLNVFSPEVQRRHGYLPHLVPAATGALLRDADANRQ